MQAVWADGDQQEVPGLTIEQYEASIFKKDIKKDIKKGSNKGHIERKGNIKETDFEEVGDTKENKEINIKKKDIKEEGNDIKEEGKDIMKKPAGPEVEMKSGYFIKEKKDRHILLRLHHEKDKSKAIVQLRPDIVGGIEAARKVLFEVAEAIEKGEDAYTARDRIVEQMGTTLPDKKVQKKHPRQRRILPA